eukprot:217334_1
MKKPHKKPFELNKYHMSGTNNKSFDWKSLSFLQCMRLCDGYIRSNVKIKQVPNVINELVIAYVRSSNYQIFVKHHTGKYTIVTDLYPNDTVKNLKMKVEEQEDYPIKQQLLFTTMGKQMEDDITLEDYGIHNESTVLLKKQIR